MFSYGRQTANKLRVRVGVRRWAPELPPTPGRRHSIIPKEVRHSAVIRDRRQQAYRREHASRSTFNSRTQAWTDRFERPVTLMRHAPFKSVHDVPAHRRCFYPKERVPKRYLPLPNYARIVQRVRQVRALFANDDETEHLVRQHIEAIHEEEHIMPVGQALASWDEMLARGARE